MQLHLGQRVIATDDLRFGIFTNVPQGMLGTVIEIAGIFSTKCVVHWDNGQLGEVHPDLIAPAGR